MRKTEIWRLHHTQHAPLLEIDDFHIDFDGNESDLCEKTATHTHAHTSGQIMDQVGKCFWVKIKINFTKLKSIEIDMQRGNELVPIHIFTKYFDLTWPQYHT